MDTKKPRMDSGLFSYLLPVYVIGWNYYANDMLLIWMEILGLGA